MRKSFTIDFFNFLKENTISFRETESKEGNTTLVYINDFPLCFHLIPLKNISAYSPELFAQMSDEADRQLIHVWEDLWINKTQLVKKRILSLMGITHKIHARQTSVVKLTQAEADVFLTENHLQDSTKAQYRYGLLHKGTIVAVATFSKGRKMTYQAEPFISYELIRFCTLSGSTINGGFSKLLQHFIKEYSVKHLMTYADRDWSVGRSYTKLGFTLEKVMPPTFYYLNQHTLTRQFPNRLTSEQIADCVKIYNSGSLKFVKIN